MIQIVGVPDFWERVRRAPHWLLALDYDGTLAPFQVHRDRATPLDGVREALKAIGDQHGTNLAILSGRGAHEVMELIGRDLALAIFGAHGYERFHSDGTFETFPPRERQEQGLTRAVRLAVDAGFSESLESKSASVALHSRALENAHDVEERLIAIWTPLAAEHDLIVRRFDGGVELCARGRNKGTALANLYEEMPPGTLPVYVGDDSTDEDAFHYVKAHGIGIKVGLAGTTAASGRVPDPGAVLAILRCWHRMMAAAG